jgi:hypothetical protein
MRMADLATGWAVVGNDGGRVGQVREVGQNYLLASTGGLASDIYIPASAIANVENEVVYLNVPQRDVAEMGWEQPPRNDDAPAASPETDLHRHV